MLGLKLGNPSTAASTAAIWDLANLMRGNHDLRGVGNALSPWKFGGSTFAIALNAGGRAVTFGTPTVPSDATAIRVEPHTFGATDYLFWASRAAILANDNTGVDATDLSSNIAKNLGGSNVPNWHVMNGEYMILPFEAAGVIPATWRLSRGYTGGLCAATFVTGANFPYLMAGSEEFLLVGANGVLQMPTATAAKFPVGYNAAMVQVIGTGVRYTLDGTDPTSSFGFLLPAGKYLMDQDRHGLSLAAAKFYMPSTSFMVGHSLKPNA